MQQLLAATLLLAASAGALAHVTLETPEAAAGGSYKAVLRVPHGCDGSATTALRVILPDGFHLAKPMPKAGWQLSTHRQAVTPFDSHGSLIREDVTEIEWRGGPLPDAFYDEFVFRGTLPASGEQAWFKVLQQCERGETRWDETPAGDAKASHPAPAVRLLPPAGHLH
ncbi:YcnI family protein [Vogesella facilis]|uniref:YcnI family protein n=1 Tax=Vogesella facilis TaxID=1655232 RepID=A0ABV7RCS3_9NEIS